MFLSFTATLATPANTLTILDTTNIGSVPYYYALIGAIRIEGPTGLLHNGNLGSPEIIQPGTLSYVENLPAPSGVLPLGLYTVKLTGRFTKRTNILNVDLGTNSISIPSDITDIQAGDSINLGSGANDGTYTVDSVGTDAYGVNVVLSEALLSATVSGYIEWTEDEILTQVYDNNVTVPTLKINQLYNCGTPSFYSQDQTNYNIIFTDSVTGTTQTIAYTSLSRTMTTNAPDGLGNTPVAGPWVTSNQANLVTELWTKTWTTELEVTVTYTLPSGLVITMVLEGEDDLYVTCDNNLCCIKECIHTLYDRYHAALGCNEVEAERLQAFITDLGGAYVSYMGAKDCGDSEGVQKYYDIMKDIVKATECSCGCDEEDDALPTQVEGYFPIAVNGMLTVVAVSGVYLSLNVSVVGDTTTYTLELVTAQIETLIATYITANPTLITTIVDTMKLGVSVSTFAAGLYDVAVSFTGNTTTGLNTIAGVVYGAGITSADLKKGDPINMTDFPAGTYITNIGVGTLTVSNVSTGTTVGQAGLIKALTGSMSIQKYKRTVSLLVSYHYVVKLNDLAVTFLESAGGACGADVNTDFTLATIATGAGGNYSIQLHGQADTTTPGNEPNAIAISIIKNGSLINARAKLDIIPHMGADTFMTTVNFSLVTYEPLVATDVVKLRINPVNGGVTLTNLSALLVKIGGY